MARKIFVSYDYDEDRRYKDLLSAWSKNSNFDFSFNDQSADVGINSTNATAIKRAISAKINAAPTFLCLVGKRTHLSDWVSFEIEKAVELKKRLVAVKIDRANTSPPPLLGAGAKWASSFTFVSINTALNG